MTFAPVARRQTFFGATMLCDVRDTVPSTIRHLGAWEPRASAAFARLLRPGEVAADVGANIGYFSLLFSHLVGREGAVVAVEPLPGAIQQFKRSIRDNGLENIRLEEAAVGDHEATVLLHQAPSTNTGMSSLTPGDWAAQSHDVPMRRLHLALSMDERARLALVKIDVEGAELPILEDFLDHLDEYPVPPAVAVEANANRDPAWSAVFDRFLEQGYRAFDLHNDYDWFNLIDQPVLEPTELQALPSTSVDILFLPPGRSVA